MHYQWIAKYRDGTELRQYKDDGTENKYGDIVRNNLVGFMLATKDQNPTDFPILCVHIDPEKDRLIYRKRHEQKDNDDANKYTVWLVGFQRRVGNRVTSESISVLFPDGHIEQKPTWNEDRWFYPPGEADGTGNFVRKVHAHEGELWDFQESSS